MWLQQLQTLRLLEQWVGFRPSTTIETGVDAFARWYRDYFEV